MNAFAKHKKLVNDYLKYYSGGKTLSEVFKRDASKDKTDLDVIREEMRFVWDEEDAVDSWEKRLAKRYYDKLFKEYCICDLTLFKQNKVAMRWRLEKEVVEGKGQFICGDKRCSERDFLKSWEVNFGYVEHGQKKNALVKLRLCMECSKKLNYHHKRKEVTKAEKKKIETEELKRKHDEEEESGSEDEKNKEVSNKKLKQKEENKKVEESGEKMSKSENMIILNGDDSMWKKNADKVSVLADEGKSREEEFENYLEDLFF